jgi:hypothetical protein
VLGDKSVLTVKDEKVRIKRDKQKEDRNIQMISQRKQ